MTEADARAEIVKWGRSLFERSLTPGSSGNISVKLADGYLVTPTNSCLGFLEAASISKLDGTGEHLSGAQPTKELPLHLAFYQARPTAGAVVHLHSTYATLLACLADVDPDDAIPPITPYAVMRLGRVPIVQYFRPGSAEIVPAILASAATQAVLLLANHGPVAAGASLEAAMFAIEELEETAKLVFLTRQMPVRTLDRAAIDDLNATFRL